jgi:1,4-dihydroxy-2-naphthoate octaprenyltransferase
MRPPPTTRAGAWLLATRPRTLVAGAVPVLVGTALAAHTGQARAMPALAALLGAVLIQIGTNLVNDYYDFKKGADAERVGETRVSSSGLIPPEQVLAAAGLSGALATIVGLYLVTVGGWPIMAIGLASLLAGFAYTGGPFPLGYHGLGDPFVFIFFGLVAVTGTYYVQTGEVTATALLAAIPVGAIGTAIIVVNNLRDVETDARVGKRTLAVRWGVTFTRSEYVALLLVAFLVPVAMWLTGRGDLWVLLPLLSAPLAAPPLLLMLRERGRPLDRGLALTARLQAAFGILFALGLWR